MRPIFTSRPFPLNRTAEPSLTRWRPASTVACLMLALGAGATGPRRPLSVLFVGNSYTYFNNLPEMFERMVSPNRRVIAEKLTVGGMTLRGHLAGKDLEPILRKRKWDYVVIQEQSTLSNDFTVDGVSRVVDTKPFWAAARTLVRRIRATGAKPVLFMTWKRKAAPDRDQAFLDYAYSEAARRGGCVTAPVGRAWARMQRLEPGVETYFTDGSHPDEMGTYIAAATFARLLAGVDLSSLPSSITYRFVILDDGSFGKGNRTFSIDARQRADVAKAVRMALAARPPMRGPGPIPEESVATRGRVSLRNLAGTYYGRATVYLSTAAKLELSFDDTGYGICTLISGGGFPDLSSAVHVREDEGIITWRFPQGLDGANLLFRGSISGGWLTGVYERRAERPFTEQLPGEMRRIPAGTSRGFGHWTLAHS